jgi:hypothetical protein
LPLHEREQRHFRHAAFGDRQSQIDRSIAAKANAGVV